MAFLAETAHAINFAVRARLAGSLYVPALDPSTNCSTAIAVGPAAPVKALSASFRASVTAHSFAGR